METNQESQLDDITAACYAEIQNIEKHSFMKEADSSSIKELNDLVLCEQIDTLCPVLSSALKGAQGSVHRDTNDAKICRTLCYGSVFKTR